MNLVVFNLQALIILYRYKTENHMYEYIQRGKAWDIESIEKTGKEYIRQVVLCLQ